MVYHLPEQMNTLAEDKKVIFPNKGALSNYWRQYYRDLFKSHKGKPWLDYSNDRVQAQTFALVLEGVGSVLNKSCLDVGCGWGQFAIFLSVLGGKVAAFDIIDEMIDLLKKTAPSVSWFSGDVSDRDFVSNLGFFDVISLVEVLQYVDVEDTINHLWDHLNKGGRLVGVVPNAECSIVQNAIKRFNGRYKAVLPEQLSGVINSLTAVDDWYIKGLVFRDDQKLWPYEDTKWTKDLSWIKPPNRLLFVVSKKT